MITLNARVQIPVEVMAAHKLEHGSGMPPDLLNDLAAYLGKQLIEAKCVEFETRNNNSMSMLEIIARARVLEPGEQQRVLPTASYRIGGTYDR